MRSYETLRVEEDVSGVCASLAVADKSINKRGNERKTNQTQEYTTRDESLENHSVRSFRDINPNMPVALNHGLNFMI